MPILANLRATAPPDFGRIFVCPLLRVACGSCRGLTGPLLWGQCGTPRPAKGLRSQIVFVKRAFEDASLSRGRACRALSTTIRHDLWPCADPSTQAQFMLQLRRPVGSTITKACRTRSLALRAQNVSSRSPSTFPQVARARANSDQFRANSSEAKGGQLREIPWPMRSAPGAATTQGRRAGTAVAERRALWRTLCGTSGMGGHGNRSARSPAASRASAKHRTLVGASS